MMAMAIHCFCFVAPNLEFFADGSKFGTFADFCFVPPQKSSRNKHSNKLPKPEQAKQLHEQDFHIIDTTFFNTSTTTTAAAAAATR